MSCSECNKVVNRNTDLKVYCAICRLVFHAICVNLNESDVEFLNENNGFFCNACVKEKNKPIVNWA